ncbi:MAG: gamma-glutamyltransferase family protein [Acidimicrobiia bacterium]
MIPGHALRYPQAALATPHYLASAAGAAVFARGGNAIDAIVGANLALGVVAPYYCGYGGDIFAIVWDGELHGYLGSGRSPAAATIAAVRDALGETPLLIGPHSVTVPGAIAGWFELLDRFGTMSFGELAVDAIRYARDGFSVTPLAGAASAGYRSFYRHFPEWQSVYGERTTGDLLVQEPLARLIELLASGGPDAYYRGPAAQAIETTIASYGGFMATSDLAAHAGRWAAPLVAPYRDVEIAELPPPTQGAVVLEIMRMLDGFDLRAMTPADREHMVIEAVKLGLRDRDDHVSDPAAMRIDPTDLLTDSWIDARRAAIDPARAGVPAPGHPQRGGTAYLCASDGDGLLVSLIQSNFLAFGSGIHVAEWGINLNNRGSSFSLDESSVNALAPSKLPMHTLIPGMVLRDGTPEVVFGSMGGDAQAQIHAQLITRIVDDGTDLQAAIDAPRWRVEPWDWKVRMEAPFDSVVRADLADRGHVIIETPARESGMGHAHAIRVGPDGYAIATDPRAEGAAVGL